MDKICSGRNSLMVAAIFFAVCIPAFAQNDPNAATAAETAKTKADTEKLKAETDNINAQADRDRARVSALGLPSYEGTTKLNSGAGEMEAMLLTAPAVRLAGSTIADDVPSDEIKVLLLTRDDAFDFGLPGSLAAEMDGIKQQYLEVFTPPAHINSVVAIALISAIAGMARSETEVTSANVPVGDSMLLTAVAAKLKNRARLPASAIETVVVDPGGTNSPILGRLIKLAQMDADARDERDRLAAKNGGKPDDNEKAQIAKIDAVRKRYSDFFSRITMADAQGAIPISRAARIEQLMTGVTGVLRVHVEKAGGSLVNTKNIATFFGADPVRVSGGLVVSYLLTTPSDGTVKKAGILQCRTAMARLRAIQENSVTFSENAAKNHSECNEDLGAG